MYLLAWIVVGAVVGWGSGKVFRGNGEGYGHGPLMDTLMGVGGGIVGGSRRASLALAAMAGPSSRPSWQWLAQRF